MIRTGTWRDRHGPSLLVDRFSRLPGFLPYRTFVLGLSSDRLSCPSWFQDRVSSTLSPALSITPENLVKSTKRTSVHILLKLRSHSGV